MKGQEVGVSNVNVRIENRKKLIKLLYLHDGMTKQEIARNLCLSLPTVNGLVQELEEENIVYFQKGVRSSGGRIPTLVWFNKDVFAVVGVEITETGTRIALMNMACNIIEECYMKIPFSVESDYWKEMNFEIQQLLSSNQIPESKLLGIGISMPGPVDREKKRVESVRDFHIEIRDFNYEYLEQIFDCPFVFCNDANAAGFAEVWLKTDIYDAVYLSVSKGVGGALIRSNSIVLGENCNAGEIGHMVIQVNGKPCQCGRAGCFETYCSTRVLLKAAATKNLKVFFEKKKTDDGLQKVWEEYLDYLALGISNLSLILDMPIILGGEIAPYIEEDFERLTGKISKLIPFERSSPVCILSKFRANGYVVGSALLIITEYLGIA
ncbi:ROK family protein [Lachnoclostridium sp. An131]|uniref:ROK family protein n=1 Tax=Lachnoclostridium sp. An131 TaxID=1965555 RepID=UPI0013A6102D|nr:ROK family transcriptional regulator [Lachnoclostridium sp. An131]